MNPYENHYTDCHKSIPFEAIFRVAVKIWGYFGFWNSEFGFKVFYLYLLMDRAKRYRQSKIRNQKSKICKYIKTVHKGTLFWHPV